MAAEREAFRGPSSTSIVRSRIDIIFGVFLNHKWKEKVLQGAFKSAGVFIFLMPVTSVKPAGIFPHVLVT